MLRHARVMVIGVGSDLKCIGLNILCLSISFMSPKGFTDFYQGFKTGFLESGTQCQGKPWV